MTKVQNKLYKLIIFFPDYNTEYQEWYLDNMPCATYRNGDIVEKDGRKPWVSFMNVDFISLMETMIFINKENYRVKLKSEESSFCKSLHILNPYAG